jgi:cold shock CspA family protein
MAKGVIARLVIERGFGFVRDDAGVEHFFHASVVEGARRFSELALGDRLTFEPDDPTDRGPRARQVWT